VIFKLVAELSTISTRPPHRSIRSASSVAAHRSRTARSCALTSVSRLKACGVCACHKPSRATVAVATPAHEMHTAWQRLLPGFEWISWGSFFLGLVESYAWGWYVTLIWVPLYNVISARQRPV
jgi:hypothetical protein